MANFAKYQGFLLNTVSINNWFGASGSLRQAGVQLAVPLPATARRPVPGPCYHSWSSRRGKRERIAPTAARQVRADRGWEVHWED